MKATIAAFGNTVHSFIQREDQSSHGFPFYVSLKYPVNKSPMGLEKLYHVAIAVETGSLEKWQKFYEEVLGFYVFSTEDIYTNDSGMKSVVVSAPSETIKFVLVEGITGKKNLKLKTTFLIMVVRVFSTWPFHQRISSKQQTSCKTRGSNSLKFRRPIMTTSLLL
jgi:4-hydroxyphenylpyruvate dioxygenase